MTRFLSCMLIIALTAASARAADDVKQPEWIEAMRAVHAKFKGEAGTLALFGDSITVSLAFWAPLAYDPKQQSKEMAAALKRVKAYQKEACWRQWRGPEYGNEGGMTIRWAHDNIDAWLKKLNPEVAVIMFGTNDLTIVEQEEYEKKTREVVEKCLKNGTVVLLTTIPPRHNLAEKASKYAFAVRRIGEELKVPVIDFNAGVLIRRHLDWDGALPQFKATDPKQSEYDVPTLIARDGVHPSNPKDYQDYSTDSLKRNGFALRNYLTVVRYAEVIDKVLKPDAAGKNEKD